MTSKNDEKFFKDKKNFIRSPLSIPDTLLLLKTDKNNAELINATTRLVINDDRARKMKLFVCFFRLHVYLVLNWVIV